MLAEPLLKGRHVVERRRRAGTTSRALEHYLGQEKVTVPAFPTPVTAAKVRTEITQTGALGDPYGSGVRTVWWVCGVGPVKVVFEHAGGAKRAGDDLRAPVDEPGAAAAAAGRELLPAREGAEGARTAGRTRST